MSKRLFVWSAAAALLATGPACRLCHKDQCGARRDLSPPACDGMPTAFRRSAAPLTAPIEGMVSGGDPFPAYPTSFGGPSYPVGEPVPLRSQPASPANELPYPSIPTPGVPEGPVSSGATTVVPPTARTTGDQRYGR